MEYRLDVSGIYSGFDKKSFERRVKVKFYGIDVWINSPEDLVLAKILLGSEQYIKDAVGILKRQSRLDLDYITQESKPLGIADKVKQILSSLTH